MVPVHAMSSAWRATHVYMAFTIVQYWPATQTSPGLPQWSPAFFCTRLAQCPLSQIAAVALQSYLTVQTPSVSTSPRKTELQASFTLAMSVGVMVDLA